MKTILLRYVTALPLIVWACDGGPLSGCDDPFPALVVTASNGTERIELDKVDVFVGDQLVLTIPCAIHGCETQSLATGTYRVVAIFGVETRERTVSVENSHALSHQPTLIEFVFPP